MMKPIDFSLHTCIVFELVLAGIALYAGYRDVVASRLRLLLQKLVKWFLRKIGFDGLMLTQSATPGVVRGGEESLKIYWCGFVSSWTVSVFVVQASGIPRHLLLIHAFNAFLLAYLFFGSSWFRNYFMGWWGSYTRRKETPT